MEPIRQNGHVQQAFPYGNAPSAPTDSSNFSTVQFSDPWKGGANPTSAPYPGMSNPAASLATTQGDLGGMKQPLRQNSVSSTFDQLSLNLPTTRALPSQNLYQADFIPNAGYATSYPEQAATTSPTARASTNYAMGGYGSYDQTPKNNLYSIPSSLAEDRRLSHPSLLSPVGIMDSPLEPLRQRQSSLVDYTRPGVSAGTYHTADTLDASRGMLALNQATRFSLPHVGAHRASSSASSSSYYPQSTSSSISSASSYPYYSGSMDSGATDLTSISDMYDAARPNLPRPAGLISGHHLFHQGGQAAMMGQFNSRVQSNTTKKHKCKICDKRFTRPSSLQTHMYSHTGEKPFACEVEGCGRQFSVVSNLRRHRKVHKPSSSDTETISNAGSI